MKGDDPKTNIFYQTNMQLFLTREPKRISVEHKTMRACPTKNQRRNQCEEEKQKKFKIDGEEVAAVRNADKTDRSVRNLLEAIIIIN